MTHVRILLAVFSIVLGDVCFSQEVVPVDDFKPASTNQDGKEFPQVNSEGRVKIRVIAPDANWAEKNGMTIHGHTLVWHAQTPGWFFEGDKQ